MANTDTTDQVDPVSVEIGARIHTLMWRNRRNQSQLAAVLGITQATVSRKLRGHVPLTATELVKVAAFLGVRPGALLDDDAGGALTPGITSSLLPRLDSNQQPSGYPSPRVSGPRRWLKVVC